MHTNEATHNMWRTLTKKQIRIEFPYVSNKHWIEFRKWYFAFRIRMKIYVDLSEHETPMQCVSRLVSTLPNTNNVLGNGNAFLKY